jgi:hypothetical protein
MPLAGLTADALAGMPRRRASSAAAAGAGLGTGAWHRQLSLLSAQVVVTVALTGAALLVDFEGAHSVLHGHPRPLREGNMSVLTMGDMETRFIRTPAFLPEYQWAVGRIKESGARRIGMDVEVSNFEYPLWVMLPGRDLVQLRSVVPGHPGASPESVDAVVCFSPPLMEECTRYVPQGWTLEVKESIALALPPGK